MQRIMFQASEDLIGRVKAYAHSRGISVAQVVREALEKDLGSSRRRRSRLIGAFDSGGKSSTARDSTRLTKIPPQSWR